MRKALLGPGKEKNMGYSYVEVVERGLVVEKVLDWRSLHWEILERFPRNVVVEGQLGERI